MKKLIIFDLDGVLLDSKQLHFNAFNIALKKSGCEAVSQQYHDQYLCGYPTTKKLEILGISNPMTIQSIRAIKQSETLEQLSKIEPDEELITLCQKLVNKKILLACASNSLIQTIKITLSKLGIIDYFSAYIGNDNVSKSKPSPEMYWACMVKLGIYSPDTLIIEDSPIGMEAIRQSGADGLNVKNRQDLTINKIFDYPTVVYGTYYSQ